MTTILKKTRSLEGHEPLVWSEVDLGRLRRNLDAIRASIRNPEVGILAVVKADAYGHGVEAVARTLASRGVRFFGVATVREGTELRRICPKADILVLGSFHKDQVPIFMRHRLRPTISSLEDARYFHQKASRRAFPVHVKVDTGMGRLGVWHEEADSFFEKLLALGGIRLEGVYTHFFGADQEDPSATERQFLIFERVLGMILKRGFRPEYVHAANSMGLLRFRRSHLNLVRPGILLYGIHPAPNAKLPAGLEPILSLKTRISFLKDVGRGRTLSYGATYRVPRKTRIATLPVGYSHGYRVGFSNKAQVIVRGRRCPVVGRVTMDQTLVDVGRIPAVRRWEEVTLIGENGSSNITVADLASLAGSIPYEIICALNHRIPRIYKGL